MTTTRLQMFNQPVDFIDCDSIAVGFRSILRGWDIVEVPFDPDTPAYMVFEKRDYGYHWDAPWIADKNRRVEDPSVSVMDAVCDFHYEFIDWFVDQNPDHFCLHMAGVEFDGKAVVFPCVQKAGKSTLALHLSMLGHRLLGDDVVAMSTSGGKAISLGLLPRMRLPLPKAVIGKKFKDFIDARQGLSDRHWQYVDLSQAELAPLWTELPVAGIVLLERGADGPPTLVELSKSDAIKALIDRNFGQLRNPDLIFDALRDVSQQCQTRLLRFSRPDDAAKLLQKEFGGGRM